MADYHLNGTHYLFNYLFKFLLLLLFSKISYRFNQFHNTGTVFNSPWPIDKLLGISIGYSHQATTTSLGSYWWDHPKIMRQTCIFRYSKGMQGPPWLSAVNSQRCQVSCDFAEILLINHRKISTNIFTYRGIVKYT